MILGAIQTSFCNNKEIIQRIVNFQDRNAKFMKLSVKYMSRLLES